MVQREEGVVAMADYLRAADNRLEQMMQCAVTVEARDGAMTEF